MPKYSFDDIPDPNLTTVNSKTYGEHTRARRGSKSKVEVNDTLKAHNLLLTSANVPASLVKKAIDSYRSDFPCGQLWQFLVGMFKTQLKKGIPLNVNKLMLKDINKEYTLGKFIKHGFKREVTSGPATVRVDISNLKPEFRSKSIDGYQVEGVAICFNFEQMETTSESSTSPIVPLSHDQILNFELKLEKPGDQYLICIKLNACIRGQILTENSAKCMYIIETGVVKEDGLEKAKLY